MANAAIVPQADAAHAPSLFGGSQVLWIGFGAIVLGALFVDLFVLNRDPDRYVSLREALVRGGAFIALALVFCAIVAWKLGSKPAIDFLTGYVVELSLSFDNLFVFLVLFKYFGVERKHEHRVLFWGILGALVLRAVFIVAGVALIHRFEWVLYIFGLFLVLTGIKLLKGKEEEADPQKNAIVRIIRKLVPVSTQAAEGRFFVVENGKRVATTLFLCLLAVEASDVVFAVDSIPAIFGVTLDPFVVYTSNVFAILGLRSFYTLLARLMAAFRYLNVGLAIVLIFIGVKMLSEDLQKKFGFHIGPALSLSIVFGTLAGAIVLSLVRRPRGPLKASDEPGRRP